MTLGVLFGTVPSKVDDMSLSFSEDPFLGIGLRTEQKPLDKAGRLMSPSNNAMAWDRLRSAYAFNRSENSDSCSEQGMPS